MRVWLAAIAFTTLLSVAYAASGVENWPGKTPLRFELIASPGGLLDVVLRELSPYVSASIGAPVVVENRPGAGGNIAAAFVARAQPDGHALLVTGSNQAVNPTLLPNPGFDYARDLAPVAMTVSTKMLLVAAPAFPANTITDVIAIAKRKPKSVSIVIPPIGSPGHLGAEMLVQFGAIDLISVPYDGIAQAIPDLLANRMDLAIGSMPTMLPLVRSGALKALAVTSAQRSVLAPEIPNSAEAGLPQLQIDSWICIMTTGGTPAPIIVRLDGEVAKALALPAVRAAFAKLGIEIFYMNSQALGKFLRSQALRFGSLLKHSRLVRLPR